MSKLEVFEILAIRNIVLLRQESGMRNERGDFQPEQLPQARVHFSVARLPLLPCAQLAVHERGGR